MDPFGNLKEETPGLPAPSTDQSHKYVFAEVELLLKSLKSRDLFMVARLMDSLVEKEKELRDATQKIPRERVNRLRWQQQYPTQYGTNSQGKSEMSHSRCGCSG